MKLEKLYADFSFVVIGERKADIKIFKTMISFSLKYKSGFENFLDVYGLVPQKNFAKKYYRG